jgi:acyl dehydratase
MLEPGQSAEISFCVTQEEMELFQQLSGDHSLIHTDAAYAAERGFPAPIAYGGIMLAKLSQMVGMHLPGKFGTSVSWVITYRNPLYVGEHAVLRLEVVSVSRSVGLVEGKFSIQAGDKRVADGKTQSIVPTDLIGDPTANG